MGLFGKKKKKDEEEEFEPSEKSVKKIKDLKPENKRKRKPKIRNWSKFDRIVIAIMIIATAGTSSYLALKSRDFKLPGMRKPSLKDLNPFEKEIVLEADSDAKKRAEGIISEFEESTLDLSGTYGLYVVDLDADYSFGVMQDQQFQAASLIKLPVMAGMYLAEEQGDLDLDDKYYLKSEDRITGAGSLYSKPVGYETTFRNLIRLMAQQSDNTAFNICRKYLGDEKVNEIANTLGMVDTDVKTNMTTPRDVGFFFENLYFKRALDEKNTIELMEFMTNTVYENWLAEGVDENATVSHKYGREVHVVNDAGIVYDPKNYSDPGYVSKTKPYVIVILSKGVVDREADEIFPILSRNIFRAFNGFE